MAKSKKVYHVDLSNGEDTTTHTYEHPREALKVANRARLRSGNTQDLQGPWQKLPYNSKEGSVHTYVHDDTSDSITVRPGRLFAHNPKVG